MRGQEISMDGIAARLRIAAVLVAAGLVGATAVHAQSAGGKTSSGSAEKPTLRHEIHHQLAVLPFYSVFDYITFTIRGPEILLTGQVLRATLKADAEGAVKSLEGVGVVVSQIEVLPASPSDDELRRAVYRTIFENSTLSRYGVPPVPPIHIIVKNGAVTLEGAVDSAEDKSLAAARASSVANVQDVRNNLMVQPQGGAGE
jgi:hyperosmotically inducible periplasmic protein